MKAVKKYKTILLLLIVIALYGVIGIRIKDSVSIDNKINYNATHPDISTQPKIDIEDKELDLNYRNPFAINSTKHGFVAKQSNLNDNNRLTNKRDNKIQKNKAEPKMQWDKIKLRAIIMDNQNKVCVIEINNTQQVLKETEILDDYQIVNIFKDSVSILYNSELKIFKL